MMTESFIFNIDFDTKTGEAVSLSYSIFEKMKTLYKRQLKSLVRSKLLLDQSYY